jgi:hypothetical protein
MVPNLFIASLPILALCKTKFAAIAVFAIANCVDQNLYQWTFPLNQMLENLQFVDLS